MQTYPMDLVIKSVEDDEEAISTSATKLVLIDIDTRTAVAKKRFFHPVRRYVVANTNNPNSFSEGTLSYKLKSLDYAIPLTLTYSVRCRPGSETRVAQALFHVSDPPGIVLEDHIKRWLGDLSQPDIAAFVDQCLTDRAEVQRSLQQKALADNA